MKKLLAVLLAATATAASAAPVTVTFEYEGFRYAGNINTDPAEPEWQPWVTYSASFTGEDLDGDNTIRWNEVTKLTAAGFDFFSPQLPDRSHSLEFFEYRSPSDYKMDLSIYQTIGEHYGFAHEKLITLSQDGQHIYWHSHEGAFERWDSTNQTTVTVSAVPEPSTALMLGAGLGLTGLAAFRRRPQRRAK